MSLINRETSQAQNLWFLPLADVPQEKKVQMMNVLKNIWKETAAGLGYNFSRLQEPGRELKAEDMVKAIFMNKSKRVVDLVDVLSQMRNRDYLYLVFKIISPGEG